MRVKYSWILALLLSGCQLTQPQTEPEKEATNHVAPSPADVKVSPTVVEQSAIDKPATAQPAKPIAPAKPVITPQTQKDVWHRIAMQLKMEVPDNKSVNYYRTWYLKHPSHLRTVSKRAEPFLYLITTEIEKRNLPLELALLPIVESSFDPFAYSHGSAAGLWQFVPGTAKRFNLTESYWYDGRRDVVASTEAALDYLTYLNKRFDGNWYHAIAAYNSGGGRVSSAIRRNKNAGKSTDFFSLPLPKETVGYVPKLLALADVIANQDKYGISIPPIANKPVLEHVNPKEQLDLAIAAKYAGISVSELQSYNPAYNQWATSPSGPQQLLIPVGKVERFKRNVANNHGKGMKLIRYKVQPGDTISVLAQKYATTSSVIRKANSMESNNLRAGRYIMIPSSTKDDTVYALSAHNRLAKTQSKARGQYKLTHTVRSGDSFWTLARAHNVSVQSLARWNGMGPKDTLHIGQKLVIWKKGSQGAVIRTVVYQVRSGDTLSGIAHHFKVKTADVVKWNELENTKYLKPKQKLKLYVDVTKVSV